MRLIIDIADCMLNGHGVKEAIYYELRMSVLEGSAWHSPVDLPIHPVTRLAATSSALIDHTITTLLKARMLLLTTFSTTNTLIRTALR
jgi:hypothetical protein